VIGALLGADEFGFATAPLVVEGCIMMRKCHLNTCPVGVATQDPVLRRRFAGQPEHVVNYFFFVAEEARRIMAQLGVRRFVDLIGRTDLLDTRKGVAHWKAKGLDFTRIFHQPAMPAEVARHQCERQNHGLERALDHEIIKAAAPALEKRQPVRLDFRIRNANRSVGAMLSGELARRYGHEGLPEDTIHVAFEGIAGQSFGAFLAHGVTFELQGATNDYVGKGLSGGRVVVYPDASCPAKPEENIVIGNTVMYGAIAGEAYYRGVAGERFCVRNSGAAAVVEGTGDHGCEYMTGGTVVVLGRVGYNLGAGMTGGQAFVWDPLPERVMTRVNDDLVEVLRPDHDALGELRWLVERHVELTGSRRGADLLADWDETAEHLWHILPRDRVDRISTSAARRVTAA
jgi:glutamate synthase (NADPH/NADH) large chain